MGDRLFFSASDPEHCRKLWVFPLKGVLPFFVRGNSNRDRVFDISDPVATLGFLFLGAEEMHCLDAADANDDGSLDISDAVHSLGFLFLGGLEPPAPFRRCGFDPTGDELDCVQSIDC